jgi:hypothetical protein
MINTKKKVSIFFGNYDQVESVIRSGEVSFIKRTIEISHQDMPSLEFDGIDQNNLTCIAIEHLQDQDFVFENVSFENQTVDNTPQNKHSSKVFSKQQAIIEMFNNGWLDCKLIAKQLKVRPDLVYHTIRYYKFSKRIVPYEKYQCNKIDKVNIIKNYVKNGEYCVGNSIKAVKNDLQKKYDKKFGSRLIKKTFAGCGLSYSNWAYMSRKKFDGKGN